MHPFSWSNLIRFLLVIVMGVFYCRVTGEMVLSSKNPGFIFIGVGKCVSYRRKELLMHRRGREDNLKLNSCKHIVQKQLCIISYFNI